MGRDGRGVRKSSASSIEISFTYEGRRCRERIALKPTTANLKRAEAHRGAVLHAIATGTFDYAATFPNSKNISRPQQHEVEISRTENYLSAWLDRKRKHVSASTYEGYRNIVNNVILPQFFKTTLKQITRREIRAWLDNYDADATRKVSNKRLTNIQSCLRSALTDAVDDELIEFNPLDGWVYKRKEGLSKISDVDPLSPEEQSAAMARMDSEFASLIHFGLWTGLRTSEVIALEWGDIDFLRGEFTVRQALTRAAKGVPETTKTTSGTRSVKLLAPALAVLKAQKTKTFVGGSGAVFVNPETQDRWSDSQIYRKWGRALKLAGVRYRRPYQTRHTYASMMLSAGEHPMWVASQMGHKDWTMIARVYGKWMPLADMSAGSKAVDLFSKKPELPTNIKTA